MNTSPELDNIINDWPEDQGRLKDMFLILSDRVREPNGVTWELVSRVGISYSLRANVASKASGRIRPVYVVLDVVIAEQEAWFLSLCFYADEASDPEGVGNLVPRGLYDEDALCFDLDGHDYDLMDYMMERVREAWLAACGAGAP